MATNNHQRDEPRIIALERKVQTLATAIERLTKQNHDLEKQLRQRSTGPNNHRKEQEGTNAKWRDQEGLEGSNASSKQEGQDTSHPSIVDMAPLYMVVEMQMMKERMDFMMNAFRG